MQTLKWLTAILVLLVIIGMVYQFTGMLRDRQHYPPPGQMVDVGGYRLHLNCTGKGSPTVVLEAAASGWSIYWALIQAKVERLTQVCAYDRAGLGWSDPGPLPRTGQQMAKELHRLLERADVPGPYILVGHSFGGLVARVYRQEHRQDVAAMVLVDADHELELRQAEFRTFFNAGKSTGPVLRAMTMLGLSRFFASFDSLPLLEKQLENNVPENIRPMLRVGWLRTSYPVTVGHQVEGLPDTLEQVRRDPSLDDLPLIILTAAGPIWRPDLPDAVDQVKFRRMWLELQQDLLKRSSNSRQVMAEESGHFMPFDQPGLIVEGIQQLVDSARTKSLR